MLRFPATSNIFGNIPIKNSVKGAPACTAITQVSDRSHNVHTANLHLRGSGERNGEQRNTVVSFSRAIMQASDCCSRQKGTSQDEAMLISQEIKPVVMAIIE